MMASHSLLKEELQDRLARMLACNGMIRESEAGAGALCLHTRYRRAEARSLSNGAET